MQLPRGLIALAAIALAGCGGSGPKGFSGAETRYFRFERPHEWKVLVTRPAKPSHKGEIVARSLGDPGTHKQRPLVAVDAMPGWTASFDGFVDSTAFDDRVAYRGYRELSRSSPRVRGAVSTRLIKGEAPGRDGAPVSVFDLLALSKGNLAVRMIVQVPKSDADKVPVQDILNSLELRG